VLASHVPPWWSDVASDSRLLSRAGSTSLLYVHATDRELPPEEPSGHFPTRAPSRRTCRTGHAMSVSLAPKATAPAGIHWQQVIAQFDYPVVFCSDSLTPGAEQLRWTICRNATSETHRHPVIFCIDAGVSAAWPHVEQSVVDYVAAHSDQLELRAAPLLVPAGEACKNDPDVHSSLVEALASSRMDRQACVVAIGGGAVLDAVGYAAALVHRGVRLVRMPTTVLAQNDAGVGVKNGVNAFGAKNFLGTFCPPFGVINDSRWLDTLPRRDIRAGLAEAVKVSTIRDPNFFDWLEANAPALSRCGPLLDESVRRAALLHLEHIRCSGDPFELGSARPLDYGHWSAHKLETLSGHELRHGEAVAIGMALDATYAHRIGLLDATAFGRLLSVIEALGLPLFHPALDERRDGQRAILGGLEEFREHLGGVLSVTLLRSIGTPIEAHSMDQAHIEASIDWLRDRAGG